MLRFLLLLSLFTFGEVQAQKSLVCSQYYFLYNKSSVSVVPAVFYEGGRNTYFMMRYNFEAEETLSVGFGKTFALADNGLVFTPAVVMLAGQNSGFSLNLQTTWEKDRFFASTEPMYSQFFSGHSHYLYNWAEAGIQLGEQFFGGLSLQSTKEMGSKGMLHEPGIFIGGTLGRFEMPLYLFHSRSTGPYVVLGLQWSWRKK